jgi:hypothetical protein
VKTEPVNPERRKKSRAGNSSAVELSDMKDPSEYIKFQVMISDQ